jgi:phosphoribosylaminoimidazolecarboxamide formyltransferase/IMP cyclohydrolase
VDALKLLALPRAKDFCTRMNLDFKALHCFSDAFLPFPDCVEVLKEAGILYLLQPGGSKNDPVVAEKAKALGVEMVTTGVRHFWH